MINEQIRILVVEDKPVIAESISTMLAKRGMNTTVCDTGEDAIRLSQSHQPDMIIMDIQLAGKIDGIEAAKQIRQQATIPLIYLTDFTDQQTVDRAKHTYPANYLAKPFTEAELLRAIDISITNAQNSPGVTKSKDLLVRTDTQEYVKIKPEDILFLEANRAYSHIVTNTKRFTLSSSMNQVEKQVQHPDFVRVHRKYIVNINHIAALNGNMLKVGTYDIQISKEHRDNLLNRMKVIK